MLTKPRSRHNARTFLGPSPGIVSISLTPAGTTCSALVEDFGALSGRELFEDRRRSLPHSLDLENLAAFDQSLEIALDPLHDPRSVRKGANSMDVFTLDLEEGGGLPKSPSSGFAI